MLIVLERHEFHSDAARIENRRCFECESLPPKGGTTNKYFLYERNSSNLLSLNERRMRGFARRIRRSPAAAPRLHHIAQRHSSRDALSLPSCLTRAIRARLHS